MGKALQELRRAALRDPCAAAHDQILLQPRRVDARAFERDDDAGIALDVADLLLTQQVTSNELVSIETDPDARYVRAAVRVERD